MVRQTVVRLQAHHPKVSLRRLLSTQANLPSVA